MKIDKYKFGFRDGRFITIRKFSLWQWLLGRYREYCPKCDSVEYQIIAGQEIMGPSCARCGYNEVMEELFNDALK